MRKKFSSKGYPSCNLGSTALLDLPFALLPALVLTLRCLGVPPASLKRATDVELPASVVGGMYSDCEASSECEESAEVDLPGSSPGDEGSLSKPTTAAFSYRCPNTSIVILGTQLPNLVSTISANSQGLTTLLRGPRFFPASLRLRFCLRLRHCLFPATYQASALGLGSHSHWGGAFSKHIRYLSTVGADTLRRLKPLK